MMKMTLVTDPTGNLVAAVHGHALTGKHGEMMGTVSFAPNRKLHKVEVEDDIAKITDPAEFHRRMQKHMPKS